MTKQYYRRKLRIIKYLIWSIIFNFHYLPWKQAVKLPILFLTRPYFINLKGKVVINAKPKHGMILLGIPGNDLFSPKGPFMWDNRGGKVIFHGSFGINPNSSFKIMKDAVLEIGDVVSIGQNSLVACYNNISIGNNTLISWNFEIMDTDFHPFFDLKKDIVLEQNIPIAIGNNCFVGSHTTILKGSKIAPFSVVGAKSLINKEFDQQFSLVCGIPAKVKYIGIVRLKDESINTSEIEEHKNVYLKSMK